MNRTFDRVLLARHVALSAGAVAAYVFRSELQTGYVALWIVGVSATLNFIAYLFQSKPSMAAFSRLASPVIGLGSWTALAAVTSGVASPFAAGLWLEIVLSAVALQLRGVVAVTLAAIAGLWVAQGWVGFEGAWLRLVLQSGFAAAMGMLTYLVARRWLRTKQVLDEERVQLDERLAELNRRLEDERVVAELGENVARLAHGLKNAVHSLRGFVRLIEPKVKGQSGVGPAMEGLRRAIDDLESLAHLTLGSSPAPAEGGASATGAAPTSRASSFPAAAPASAGATAASSASTGRGQPGRGARRAASHTGFGLIAEAAVRNVTAGHEALEIELALEARLPETAVADKSLEEVLIILLRNAAEAMDGAGRARIEARTRDDGLEIGVLDEGPGFAGVDPAELFKPGYTTKPGGSGYGLFLARRIVEEHGGRLALGVAPKGGARVSLWLPAATSGE